MEFYNYNKIMYDLYMRFAEDNVNHLYQNALRELEKRTSLKSGYRCIPIAEADKRLQHLMDTISPFVNKKVMDFIPNEEEYNRPLAEIAEESVRGHLLGINHLKQRFSLTTGPRPANQPSHTLSLVVDLDENIPQVVIPGFVPRFNHVKKIKDAKWLTEFKSRAIALIMKRYKLVVRDFRAIYSLNYYTENDVVLILPFKPANGKSINPLTERQYKNLVRDLEAIRDQVYNDIQNRLI